MIALVGSVLAASLVGSPHCAAMCGGFVCFYAGDADGARKVRAHLAYNAGRLASYVALGIIAGTLGAGLDRAGALAGFSRAAAVVAGVLMIVWGGTGLLRALGARFPGQVSTSAWRGPIAAAVRSVRDWPVTARAVAIGFVTTLLPCGFLYAFVAVAAGTASPLAGALVMAVFWTGTVPVMAGLGLLAQRSLGRLRERLPAVTALVLVVLGLLTVAGKFTARPEAHAHPGMPMAVPGATAPHGAAPSQGTAPPPGATHDGH